MPPGSTQAQFGIMTPLWNSEMEESWAYIMTHRAALYFLSVLVLVKRWIPPSYRSGGYLSLRNVEADPVEFPEGRRCELIPFATLGSRE